MPTIVDIQFKRRRPERFLVTLDSGEETLVSPEIALKYQFAIDKYFEEQEFEDILFEDEIRRAKDQLLRYLEIRPHSRRELWRKALQKGYAETAVDQALDDLQAVGLVDDRGFAKQFIADELRLRPCGPRLLQEKLRSRGVSPEIFDPMIEEAYLGISIINIAARIAEKYLKLHRKLPGPKLREKLSRHLAAKGFDWETISEIMSAIQISEDSQGQ